MTEKEIIAYLSQPVSSFWPKGYLGCIYCHRYEHHPIVYCPKCGRKYSLNKEMPFKDFLNICGKNGAGPMNSLFSYLRRVKDGKSDFGFDLSKESQAIYDYADKHYA